jgi:hypothetical protein
MTSAGSPVPTITLTGSPRSISTSARQRGQYGAHRRHLLAKPLAARRVGLPKHLTTVAARIAAMSEPQLLPLIAAWARDGFRASLLRNILFFIAHNALPTHPKRVRPHDVLGLHFVRRSLGSAFARRPYRCVKAQPMRRS